MLGWIPIGLIAGCSHLSCRRTSRTPADSWATFAKDECLSPEELADAWKGSAVDQLKSSACACRMCLERVINAMGWQQCPFRDEAAQQSRHSD
eukprot:5966594-Alexandrium_andersonii.AAC.1